MRRLCEILPRCFLFPFFFSFFFTRLVLITLFLFFAGFLSSFTFPVFIPLILASFYISLFSFLLFTPLAASPSFITLCCFSFYFSHFSLFLSFSALRVFYHMFSFPPSIFFFPSISMICLSFIFPFLISFSIVYSFLLRSSLPIL